MKLRPRADPVAIIARSTIATLSFYRNGRTDLDHFRIAVLSLVGMGFDLLGGLFLAYDLLGHRQGPLRHLLRVVLYSFIFGSPYTLILSAKFGLPAGFGLGLALGYELRGTDPSVKRDSSPALRSGLALFRSCCLGVGGAWAVSLRFGLCFAAFSAAALLLAYRLRFAPADEVEKLERPHLSTHKILGAAVRGLLLGAAAVLAGVAAQQGPQAARLGLKIGVVVGIVGLAAGTLSPWIEWYTDHMAERRLGLLGLLLIAAGMVLQSIQYWVVVLGWA